MKNIACFPVLVIILGIVTSAVFAEEQEKSRSYVFSVIPQIGMVYGQAIELVYPNETRGEYLSELRWDMKPLFYYGAKLDFSPADPMRQKAFFVNFSAKIGIPGVSGRMEDRDWLSVENDKLTNFSSHINTTGEWYGLDLSLGISLPGTSVFYMRFFLDLSYMRFSFLASDGYLRYAREKAAGVYYGIDDNPAVRILNGAAIAYVQNWLILAPGFSLGCPFLDRFRFEFSFRGSPLIFCRDTDIHLLTSREYQDYAMWGLFLEPGAEIHFFPSRRFALSLELSWRRIAGSRGDVYQRRLSVEDEGWIVNSDRAGTGLSLLDAALRFQIRF
jgi:outer membrane protease